MPPTTRTSLGAAIALVDWERTHAQILRYAISRMKSRDRASDITQQVIAGALDPDGSPWDPEREPDIVRHLIGRVNGAVAVERRKDRLRRDPGVVERIRDLLGRPVRTPEGELEARRRLEGYQARWKALRESFETDGDTLALQVLAQYENGAIHAPEQSRALGVDVRQIHDVRRRITRRARALTPKDTDEVVS